VVVGPGAEASCAAPPAATTPGGPEFDESATDAWAARDLLTQNTRAVSAIRSFRAAAIPSNESERLNALRQLKYLDKPSRASFDRVTRLAAKILNVPIALVSLVDEDRQWFLSRFGIEATETPRDVSFCAHAVFEQKLLIVPDTASDDRFAGNPLVVGDPQIRAYAGVPVYTSEGYAIGTLCVVDNKPRLFGETDVKALQDLALIIDDIIRVREFTLEYDRRRRKRSAKARSKAEV
jgi:GAF domain